MNDESGAAAPASGVSAGRLLREAREKQGLHIAALAASIKVSPKKLEMLESDRFDALPDATFTRALAQTVCRALKTDPAPVMRLLPPSPGHRLESVGEGLNTPFRERPGVLVQSSWPEVLSSPGYWLAGLLLVAAGAVFFLPAGLIGGPGGSRPVSGPKAAKVEPGMSPEVAGDARAAGPNPAASVVVVEVQAPAEPPAAPADTSPAPGPGAQMATPTSPAASPLQGDAMPAGMLQLRTTAASWVEVTDGRGQPLVSRLLKAGEAVGVDGVAPLRVRVGNASATQLVFRGQPTDLKAFTRDNVARLELR
ncbi:MAG: RodZ domain-containing protein [Caldimonas sp.]